VKKIYSFLSLTTILFVFACTKISNTEIGNNLIPPIDGITTLDTVIDVTTEMGPLDSIRISKFQDFVLGNIENDPLMGKTSAIINAEFKPAFFPYYFEVRKDSLFLDSIVLVLGYQGIWGDTVNPIHLKVYEISQSSRLNTDSVYPSFFSVNRSGLLGERIIQDPRRLRDSVFPFREAAANQIRIKLNNSFGNRLLKNYDSTTAYSSSDQFSSIFRGFSIVPEPGSNTLLRTSLADTNSKLAIYYRYTRRDSTIDTTVRYFRPGGFGMGASNNIVRTRTGSESALFLNNTGPDSLLHLQAGPGNYVRIKTPNLQLLSNRIIHRAELLMEQDAHNTALDGLFTVPNLFLAAISPSPDTPYRFHIPRDISLGQNGTVDNFSTFGGFPVYKNDPFGNRIASYSFNVSRYVQGVITKKEPQYDFYLFAPVVDNVYASPTNLSTLFITSTPMNLQGFGRVRLIGGNSLRTNRKMRLRLVYSKL
jgi:hypothetical protein